MTDHEIVSAILMFVLFNFYVVLLAGALVAFYVSSKPRRGRVRTAALWHMAWWIGSAFVVMAFVSQGVIFLVVMSLDTSERWRSPTGEVEPPKPG